MALRIYQQPEEIASYLPTSHDAATAGYLPVVQANREPAASFAVAVEDIGKEKKKKKKAPRTHIDKPNFSVMYRESSGQRDADTDAHHRPRR